MHEHVVYCASTCENTTLLTTGRFAMCYVHVHYLHEETHNKGHAVYISMYLAAAFFAMFSLWRLQYSSFFILLKGCLVIL